MNEFHIFIHNIEANVQQVLDMACVPCLCCVCAKFFKRTRNCFVRHHYGGVNGGLAVATSLNGSCEVEAVTLHSLMGQDMKKEKWDRREGINSAE